MKAIPLFHRVDHLQSRQESICVGLPSSAGAAPDFCLLSSCSTCLDIRVDVFLDSGEYQFAAKAMAHGELIFIGAGESLYVVDCESRTSEKVQLGAYFCDFVVDDDQLLVVSGARIAAIRDGGQFLWISPELGIDGVVIQSINCGRIRGEGEWDPPGGWIPFVICRESGRQLD